MVAFYDAKNKINFFWPHLRTMLTKELTMVPSYYGQLFINFPLNTNATLKKKKEKSNT